MYIFLFILLTIGTLIEGGFLQLLLNDTDLSNYDKDILLKKLQKELNLNNIQTVSVKKKPVTIPPSMIIPICLKGSEFLDALNDVEQKSDCIAEDFACLLGSLAPGGVLEPVEDLVKSVDDDKLKTDILLGVRDCGAWWQLFNEINIKADVKIEIGRCLLQVISQACHRPLLELIKIALE